MAGIHDGSFNPEIFQRCKYGFPEDPRAFHNRKVDLLTAKPLGQFPELSMKGRVLPGLRASLPDNGTNNLSSMYINTGATFNYSLQHVFHLPSSYGGKQPRHREGFSGTPCITLMDQQVLLPYVLSQGDGTLRGALPKNPDHVIPRGYRNHHNAISVLFLCRVGRVYNDSKKFSLPGVNNDLCS
jgi:hypothetical protein